MTSQSKTNLVYLVTHPIQYQAPLLRRIAAEGDIGLTVLFCSDLSTRQFNDPGFGHQVSWDVPLLGGYEHRFLPCLGKSDVLSFFRPLNYGLLRALRAAECDVIWIHGYMRLYHWYAMVLARLLGIKVLIRDEAHHKSAGRGPIRRFLKRLFFKLLGQLCHGFLAIGTHNRDYYLGNGIAAAKIFLMPYAVDNAFFEEKSRAAAASREQLRASLGLIREKPVILFASKMTARKRPDDLLEAYIRLSADERTAPDAYLLFIGDGEMRQSLEERVASLGWTTVKFLGFKNQTELPAYFDLCDVFVLPSTHEPWGLVVNEAMNAGRAIIVSDDAGCGPDLVRDGENGFVFHRGSVDDLQRALARLTADPKVCTRMGQRSLEIIRKWDFELDVVGLKKALRASC